MSSAVWSQAPLGLMPVPPAYKDIPGKTLRVAEAAAVSRFEKQTAKTQKNYKKTLKTTALEEASRSRLLGMPKRHINFLDYKNLCEGFSSDKKKEECEAKLKYIKEAHDVVYRLVALQPLTHPIRNGLKEKVWQKYGSINMMLLQQLDQIKEDTLSAHKESKLKGVLRILKD